MPAKSRYFLPVLAALGLLFAIVVVVIGKRETPAVPPVAEPASAPFPATLAGAGIVEANTENIAIGSALSGVVAEVPIKAGDKVGKAAVLFRLDDRDTRADLAVKRANWKSAVARVAESEAALNDARNQLGHAEKVSDPRAISSDELDRRRFAVTTAEARLGTARQEVELAAAQTKAAETTLERLTVRSPISGVVLKVNVRPGEFAPSGVLSDPLLTLGNVDQLHVRVDIDENDAWRFRPNARAIAYFKGNQKFSTPLIYVRSEPYITPKRSLTGQSTERVDTRVLQVIYAFERGNLPVYVGQQMDVFIEAPEIGRDQKEAAGKGS